jgi:hypothetical protein
LARGTAQKHVRVPKCAHFVPLCPGSALHRGALHGVFLRMHLYPRHPPLQFFCGTNAPPPCVGAACAPALSCQFWKQCSCAVHAVERCLCVQTVSACVWGLSSRPLAHAAHQSTAIKRATHNMRACFCGAVQGAQGGSQLQLPFCLVCGSTWVVGYLLL